MPVARPPRRPAAPALAAVLLVLALLAGCATGQQPIDAPVVDVPEVDQPVDRAAGAADRDAEGADDRDAPGSARGEGDGRAGGGDRPVGPPAPIRLDVTALDDPVTTLGLAPYADANPDAWVQEVPQAAEVLIRSTADDALQPAWWVAPAEPDQPLLVVLHSWSTPYDQQLTIPYARWAVENGWGLIAPDFRGVNDDPQATASDLAVSDVVDAIDWALAEGEGDPDRTFAVGFSGGGMMGLVMAGRAPDRLAGVVAWVPIHDLPSWYAWTAATAPARSYVAEIEASCGGPPAPGTPAGDDCAARSPSAWLDEARAAGVPVYIGVGLSDDIVPADQGVRAFDQLADPADRIGEEGLAQLAQGQLPGDLGVDPAATSFFDDDDPPVLATRRSGAATLVVFEGAHEMLYGPGLAWLARGLPAPR